MKRQDLSEVSGHGDSPPRMGLVPGVLPSLAFFPLCEAQRKAFLPNGRHMVILDFPASRRVSQFTVSLPIEQNSKTY